MGNPADIGEYALRFGGPQAFRKDVLLAPIWYVWLVTLAEESW